MGLRGSSPKQNLSLSQIQALAMTHFRTAMSQTMRMTTTISRMKGPKCKNPKQIRKSRMFKQYCLAHSICNGRSGAIHLLETIQPSYLHHPPLSMPNQTELDDNIEGLDAALSLFVVFVFFLGSRKLLGSFV